MVDRPGDVAPRLGSRDLPSLFLASAASGGAAPDPAAFSEIWDGWNAKDPLAQTQDALSRDVTFLEQLAALSEQDRAAFRVTMFNGEQDLAGFLQLRLNEHAVHTWDILVAFDPDVTLASDATDLIMPGLAEVVGWSGRPSPAELTVRITTQQPAATLILTVGPDRAQLSDAEAPTTANLGLPAEALVRLVYGRLDPDHTPVIQADGVELEQLRQVFRGF